MWVIWEDRQERRDRLAEYGRAPDVFEQDGWYCNDKYSRKVDRGDIKNAKIFMNKRALAQGLSWACGEPTVYEVEVTVTPIKKTTLGEIK